MAKLRGPLLSLDARQKLGGTLSYQTRTQLKRVTAIPIPSQPRTLPQVYHRQDYQDAVLRWNLLDAADKASYESAAAGQSFTPYNAWMREQLLTLPDLMARWHLDQAFGGVYFDSSKQSNPAIPFGPISIPGIWGNALRFDGIDDRLFCGTDTILGFRTAFATECWVRPQAFSVNYIMNRGASFGAMRGRLFRMEAGNTVSFRVGNATKLARVDTDAPLTLNVWTHLVGNYDGSIIQLYRDGRVQSGADTLEAPIIYNNAEEIWGALWAGGGWSQVDIEEPREYNRPLLWNEVYEHWLRGARKLGIAS